jgi:hypothetical protein
MKRIVGLIVVLLSVSQPARGDAMIHCTGTLVDMWLSNKAQWSLAVRLAPAPPPQLAAPQEIDERNWSDPRIGWGVVLLDNDGLSSSDRSTAADAPPAIRRLPAKAR